MANQLAQRVLCVAAIAIPFVGFAQSAFASKENFMVDNTSNMTIVELYVSSSNVDTWENDILESGVLNPGESTQVFFGDPSPQSCLYDILAVFEDGQTVEDYQVNVCTSTGYTFYSE